MLNVELDKSLKDSPSHAPQSFSYLNEPIAYSSKCRLCSTAKGRRRNHMPGLSMMKPLKRDGWADLGTIKDANELS